MAKTGKDRDQETADRPARDAARLPDLAEALTLNPLLAHPAAAMAAATAIGFGLANQMAGVFFGALQGMMEAANHQKAAEEAEVAAPAERPAVTESTVAGPAAAGPVAAAVEPPPVAARPVPAAKPKSRPVRKAAASAAPAARKPASGVTPVEAPSGNAGAAPKAASKAPPKTKVPVKAKAPARPRTAARASAAAETGDLKRISGIGPKLEAVLKGMGVTSLAQVAAWSDAEIARFDKELGFEGRIGRDDWVGQAKALLK
ncbi:5' DNA nuclease [Rhizobium puerariae]|uniref:5' DNA nuclease n=1 Tax=Rhizobium puerariae TaxID=1585791 RepID=A0ABV6AQL3_9HYPH